MKLAAQIREQIAEFELGKCFGYADLNISKERFWATAKTLERLQKTGVIRKITKGLFYKPEQTVFGELQPAYQELLVPYLFQKGKRVAYITGVGLYNHLGLTTQVPYYIKIASPKRLKVDRATLKLSSVKSYAKITEENYKILGLLDAFKDIKHIPDCSSQEALVLLKRLVQKLSKSEQKKIANYALYYPARVKALIGAVLTEQGIFGKAIDLLQESLNPFTKFRLGFTEKDLENAQKWNIV